MNLSLIRNRLTDVEKRFMVAKGVRGVGEGWSRRLGLADRSFYVQNG